MKITLLTSNKIRHNYFINLLSQISEEIFIIQEYETNNSVEFSRYGDSSLILKKYFEKVDQVQLKLFGNSGLNNFKKNIKILPIHAGDLNQYPIDFFSDFLQSDIYIVFGSSYIKGELVDFLIKHKAINIHAGISPYYRGADCNFWALYDENLHLVGATIHLLSKGLDNGPILYHAMSNLKTNPFEYTMSTIKSAFHSIGERIKDNSIFEIKPFPQKRNETIRYSTQNEFNEEVVKQYFEKNIDLSTVKFDNSLLKEPFFFSN